MSSPKALLYKERVLAAIRGAFIADAASMGTHWIYVPRLMAKSVAEIERPEFKNPPTPNYYSSDEFPGHYERAGMLSPYGEQLLFVTDYVAKTIQQEFKGEEMSQAMFEWSKSYTGRKDVALNKFTKNMEQEDGSGKWPNCGADDAEAHIYMKLVPVTCRYAGTAELIEKVSEAIKVHQNNQKAIAFGVASARLLEAVLLGAPLSEALETLEANLADELSGYEFQQEVVEAFARGKKGGLEKDKSLEKVLLEVSNEIMKDNPDSQFYDLAARSCAVPGSFIGPIALFYRAINVWDVGSADDNSAYVNAVRQNILAAGDTCGRAVFVGAVLAAAAVGSPENASSKWDKGIPKKWRDEMYRSTMDIVDTASQTIADSATARSQ